MREPPRHDSGGFHLTSRPKEEADEHPTQSWRGEVAVRTTRSTFAAVPEWVFSHPTVQSHRTVLYVYVSMFLDGDYGEREGKADWESIGDRTGLAKSAIYRDIKALREAGIIIPLGSDHYLMPMDDPSTTVESQSTTVEGSSTTVERTLLTEKSEDTRVDPLLGFEYFWNIYPERSGRKLGKAKTAERWKKLSLEDRRAAYRGAKNLAADVAAGRTLAKDPERFLSGRVWDDYQDAVAEESSDEIRYV